MMLIATWLLKWGSVVDGAEMSRCLAFAAQVKRALDAAGWRTRDMIDVQSFLWVIAQKPASGGSEPPILEVVGNTSKPKGCGSTTALCADTTTPCSQEAS